jgi:hypothetical protein
MAYASVTSTHKLAYQNNVTLAVQQRRSQFADRMTFQGGLKGRINQVVDLVGPEEAIVNGARGGDTPNIEGKHDSVWAAPTQLEWGKLIEKEDAIKALTDYMSPYTQTGAAAIVRGRDTIMAKAVYDQKLTGKDGTTTTPYSNTGRLVAVGIGDPALAATGMNVKKLLRAIRLLQEQEVEVEDEQLVMGLNAQEMEDLYYDITFVSKDYRKESQLDTERREVISILGVDIFRTQRFPDLDGATHRAFLWAKRGMIYGDFDPVSTMVERNVQKKYRWHPFMENWFGAVRGLDELVIEILNKKS